MCSSKAVMKTRPRTLSASCKVDFLSVEKTFGDWRTVQKTHFNDGGVFDQIYTNNQ